MKKQEPSLIKVERKEQVVRGAALWAQYNALAKAEEERKCYRELDDAKERFVIAQVAAIKAQDDAKTADEEVSMVKAYFVGKVRCMQDGIFDLTRKLHHQAASAPSVAKKLATVHAKLELHKFKTCSLRKALKVS